MSKKNPTPEEIAAAFGFDVEEVKAKLPNHGKKAKEKRQQEADATRDRIYNPSRWYDNTCKHCGRRFSADYKFVAMCSEECRRADFESIGLVWDASKSVEERYIAMRIHPPAIVPPEAMAALIALGRQYAAEADKDQGVHILT